MAEKPEQPEQDFAKQAEDLLKAQDEEFMSAYKDASLDDLIAKGFIAHTVDIAPGFSVKIRTLRKREELEVKERISLYSGSQIYVLDQINVDTLALAVVEINGVPLPTEAKDKETLIDVRKNRLMDLGDVLCLAMLEEYRSLNKALVILLKGSSKNSLARLLLGREPVLS